MSSLAVIKLKLHKVIDNFVDNHFEESSRNEVKENICVAGGSICSLIMDEIPKDYDFYFKSNPTKYAKLIKKELIVFETNNALTLKGDFQIITKFSGGPRQVVEKFDFAHAACYYDYASKELYVHPKTYQSIATKSLIYVGSEYPLASLFRVNKFIKRGWNISLGYLLKLVMDINKLMLSEPNVLKEQLEGIDIVYITNFLKDLKDGEIDKNKLFQLIDENELDDVG